MTASAFAQDTGKAEAVWPWTEVDRTEAESCEKLRAHPYLVKALIGGLGAWDSCERTDYKIDSDGINQKLIAKWPGVTLTQQFRSPETGIYIVTMHGPSPLSEAHREQIVNPYYDVNWKFDEFPGPTSEHYTSPHTGTNAQLWLERDASGNVTWLRFSYAL